MAGPGALTWRDRLVSFTLHRTQRQPTAERRGLGVRSSPGRGAGPWTHTTFAWTLVLARCATLFQYTVISDVDTPYTTSDIASHHSPAAQCSPRLALGPRLTSRMPCSRIQASHTTDNVQPSQALNSR